MTPIQAFIEKLGRLAAVRPQTLAEVDELMALVTSDLHSLLADLYKKLMEKADYFDDYDTVEAVQTSDIRSVFIDFGLPPESLESKQT